MPSIRKVLSNKNMKDQLTSEEFINKILSMMPEGQQSKEHYLKTISSPQFAQAIAQFSEALNSENYEMLLSSFGLNLSDAEGARDGVEGFIKCILKKFPSRKKQEEEK